MAEGREIYIHPNFNPTNKGKYTDLVCRLRVESMSDVDFLYVSKEEYAILEDAAHPSMKGKGHQVNGIEVKVL